MKTVSIELSDQQFIMLKNLSVEQGKSISEIVDTALEQLFFAQRDMDVDIVLSNMKQAKGIWADRDDIGETDEYVRKLRKGTNERMKRIGIWNNEKLD